MRNTGKRQERGRDKRGDKEAEVEQEMEAEKQTSAVDQSLQPEPQPQQSLRSLRSKVEIWGKAVYTCPSRGNRKCGRHSSPPSVRLFFQSSKPGDLTSLPPTCMFIYSLNCYLLSARCIDHKMTLVSRSLYSRAGVQWGGE